MSFENVNGDYGSLLVGGFVAFALSGCVSMQYAVYLRLYPEEERFTKSLVALIWILDIVHSVFICIAVWDSLITNYGDPSMIDIIPWSISPTVELTAVVTFLVQSFYAFRMYKLSRRKLWLGAPVAVLALFRLVAASISTAEMAHLRSYEKFRRPWPSWMFTLGLSLSAGVDVIITSSLYYFLRRSRSQISDTNHVIDTLTRYALETGTATWPSLYNWKTLNTRHELRKFRGSTSNSGNRLPVIFPTEYDADARSPGVNNPVR
ncbi:hypothetical protein CONPUDRAFT_145480 [Coniophora puteana RWD-64-598 SS2]|uniref:DUF6534 domain-containing protein n=1 Tax=Coniophora puteana (strain RWD-64-598) TaxID=741705 RepID=A0A5M3MH77_CONPW|nr:uncharacterized protein CONPUDRAFT_145480 [Coniophora puteana RWD-64-598 SS2]EIW78134.1 hypothetical protein CONPUDRAFT_145480 [Coniophora puteana RWD-64-598 SS2]